MIKKIRSKVSSIVWKKVAQDIFRFLNHPAFYVYLIAVLVYLPWFLPNLSDISSWDETYYILRGKYLLEGRLTTLGYSPIASMFYALFYLFFKGSPFWLIHVDSLGRFFLFSFFFFGAWQVGRALKKYFHPLILFGFLFLSPILISHFEYPADPLFIFFSAITFSQAVRFVEDKRLKHLWWSSFWLGLGMLARGDAIIIFPLLSIFVLLISLRKHKWWRVLLAVTVPFLALTIGYVLVYGLVTGEFDAGIAERSYSTFEFGQEVDLPSSPGRFADPTESIYVARDLFGTPEENNYSVFKAIGRNPQAFLFRLEAVVKQLPNLYLNAYYRRYTILISLLAIRGLIALFQRKKIALAFLHLIWIVPFMAGIARTLVRVGYFHLFFFVLFSLAAMGLQALLDGLKKGWEGILWAGLFIVVMISAYLMEETGIQFAMMIYLGWLLLSYLLSKRSKGYPNWQGMALLLLLAVGFMLKVDFLIYQPRLLGEDYREQASLVLREISDPDDQILTGTPSVVIMAERQVANFSSTDIPEFGSSEDFIQWMIVQDFDIIYFDWEAPPYFWNLISEQIGKALTQVWASPGVEAYIYIIDQ